MSNLYIIDKISKGGAEKILADVKIEKSIVSVIVKSGDNTISSGISDRGYIGKLCNSIFLIKKLYDIVRENNVKNIVSFLERSNFVAVVVGVLTGVNTVISIHNFLSQQYSSKTKVAKVIIKYLIKTLYNRADKIICVSAGIKDDLVSNFGVNSNKVRVIYNGVDTDVSTSNEYSETSPYLFVGRITYQKGIDSLVSIYNSYLDKGGCRALVIIGEEVEELSSYCKYKVLPSLSNIKKLEKGIYFVGTTSNVYDYMKDSHALLLTSRWEGFGLVIAESMACKTPVITFDTPSGPNEILNTELNGKSISLGDGGILVDYNNDKAFLDAMFSLENEKLWTSLSNKAQERATYFDKKNMVLEWHNIIEGEK